jgi:hypothetical protein
MRSLNLNLNTVSEDPRLQMIKYEWVAKKACLDIGCNNGAITIEIGTASCPPFSLSLSLSLLYVCSTHFT